MLVLLQNKLIAKECQPWLQSSSNFFQLQKRLRWFCCEVFSPRAQRAVVWSCGWPRASLCQSRCWRWCCSSGPEGQGVYPQSRRYRTSLDGGGGGRRRAHWARMDQGTAQTTIDRVAHREGARQRSHQHEAQVWSCSDLRRSPNGQQGGRGAASTPGADSGIEKERYKCVNGTYMWCKVQSSETYRKWLSHAYRRLRTLTVCKEAC